jgi:hypothetical protein
MMLKQLSYETDFFWKGSRYTQVIRPKKPKGKFLITCRPTRNPCGEWLDMPAGRKVKPVLKFVSPHLTVRGTAEH